MVQLLNFQIDFLKTSFCTNIGSSDKVNRNYCTLYKICIYDYATQDKVKKKRPIVKLFIKSYKVVLSCGSYWNSDTQSNIRNVFQDIEH